MIKITAKLNKIRGAKLVEHPQLGQGVFVPIAILKQWKDDYQLDMVAFPRKQKPGEYVVKESISQEDAEAMKKFNQELPILGDMVDWEMKNASQATPNQESKFMKF